MESCFLYPLFDLWGNRKVEIWHRTILHTVPSLTLSQQALVFTCLQYRSLENTVGKGEIAHNEQFLLFPHCFLTFWKTFIHVYQISNCRLQTLSVWESLKFVVWERVNNLEIEDFFFDMEKTLVTSIFLIFRNVFHPINSSPHNPDF